MTDVKMLAPLISALKNNIPISAVYLFGSYAYGKPDESSDVDIYVLTSDKSKMRIDWSIIARKAIPSGFELPLDILVDYEDRFMDRSKKENTFEHIILSKGVRLDV